VTGARGLLFRFGRIGGLIVAVTLLYAAASLFPYGRSAERPISIVALGDSLTAGYGLRAGEAFPVRLQHALTARGYTVTVTNAGVSGDTVAGGLARLDFSVPDGTDGVILELGANDALRALDPAVTRTGLDEMLHRLKERRIPVLFCGMLAPRNLGADYDRSFDTIYPELASRYGAILYPFFLDGVVTDPKLNQADGLHPTAAGVDVIVERILPSVEELIARIRARTKA
jgi:acyl-CoA thioesterase I